MSIIHCHKHDLNFDSDLKELCPRCENTEIKVVFEYPPIPIRSFDYRATFEDDDPELQRDGWGRTKEAAINDLIANYYYYD